MAPLKLRSALGAGVAGFMTSKRNLLFLALIGSSVLMFWAPLTAVLHYWVLGGDQYDKYSYTVVVPIITLVLVFAQRRQIFWRVKYSPTWGIALLISGLVLDWAAGSPRLHLGWDPALSAKMLGLVVFWLGGFILCYGYRAYRTAIFPLLFLLLTVPIPDFILGKPIAAVRYGSAEVCSFIFTLAGVPVLRDGFRFILSTVSIEVAEECSGIHSTIAIFIISLLAGHLFLRSVWKQAVLVISSLPIVFVTNGLRIAGLTLLAEYVNPSFLRGPLHHQGGMGFFLLALIFLFVILRLLGGSPTVKDPR